MERERGERGERRLWSFERGQTERMRALLSLPCQLRFRKFRPSGSSSVVSSSLRFGGSTRSLSLSRTSRSNPAPAPEAEAEEAPEAEGAAAAAAA